MNQRQHQLLLVLLLGIYTIMGSMPTFEIWFNYAIWFVIIFFIASYIRLYPHPVFERRKLWGWISLASIILAAVSIIAIRMVFGASAGVGYYFISDCNKIFAVTTAISTFLWFKNMNIKYSKVINSFGASTFWIFLIHANSDAMRTWLWKNTIDAVGHYTLPTGQLVLFSICVVLAIFIICSIIDQLRIVTLEKYFLGWYDKRIVAKTNGFIYINK